MQPTIGRLELTVLITVARLGDEAHGLAVRAELAKHAKREYSVGAVYTTLQRLQDKGLVTSHASDPLPIRGGRSRRQFTVTTAGRKALRDAERAAASVLAGVGHILRPERA